MLSADLWNQAAYEKKWKEQPETRYLAQSKGGGKMAILPKKGDKVLFVLRGQIRMKGIIISEGFLTGTEHQEHSCNTGDSRPHAETKEFTRIHIQEEPCCEEICDSEWKRKGPWKGQKTWVRIPMLS